MQEFTWQPAVFFNSPIAWHIAQHTGKKVLCLRKNHKKVTSRHKADLTGFAASWLVAKLPHVLDGDAEACGLQSLACRPVYDAPLHEQDLIARSLGQLCHQPQALPAARAG